jgi:hypothetical protein
VWKFKRDLTGVAWRRGDISAEPKSTGTVLIHGIQIDSPPGKTCHLIFVQNTLQVIEDWLVENLFSHGFHGCARIF